MFQNFELSDVENSSCPCLEFYLFVPGPGADNVNRCLQGKLGIFIL